MGPDWRARMAQERKRDRLVLEMVERAVRDDDLRGLAEALDPIEMRCLRPRVMRRISAPGRFYEGVGRPSKSFCELFIPARQTQIAVPQLVVVGDHRGPLAKPFRFLSIPIRVDSRSHAYP